MKNVANTSTCFKGKEPTLFDVFLTNRPKSFSGVLNTDIVLSDFHNFIAASTTMHVPLTNIRTIILKSLTKHCSKRWLLSTFCVSLKYLMI